MYVYIAAKLQRANKTQHLPTEVVVYIKPTGSATTQLKIIGVLIEVMYAYRLTEITLNY